MTLVVKTENDLLNADRDKVTQIYFEILRPSLFENSEHKDIFSVDYKILEEFKNLEKINAGESWINFEKLYLPQLKRLNIDYCDDFHLDYIKKSFPNLERLTKKQYGEVEIIKDTLPTTIKKINAFGNTIHDFSFIEPLKNLEIFQFEKGNLSKESNLGSITFPPTMTHLYLEVYNLKNFVQFEKMKNLKELRILERVTPYPRLPDDFTLNKNLKVLQLRGYKIHNVYFLNGLNDLELLELYELNDIENLNISNKIIKLTLKGTIKDYSFLERLTSLESLEMHGDGNTYNLDRITFPKTIKEVILENFGLDKSFINENRFPSLDMNYICYYFCRDKEKKNYINFEK